MAPRSGVGEDRDFCFKNQTDLRAIRDCVCDTSRPLTIVAGAGVSMNASLPSWDNLVTNMAAFLTDPVLEKMIAADPSDPMRKAGIILDLLAKRNPTRQRHEFVRDALYPIGLQATPGQHAVSIARLVKARGGEVRLLTTNFDTILEDALNAYFPKEDIATFSLNEVDDWRKWMGKGKVGVLHLHGQLPRGAPPKDPIVLTEAEFLEHGPRVRETISKTLEDSDAIFVGLSMADPNLVVPLHQSSPATTRRFVLFVPRNVIGSNGGISEYARFAIVSARYLQQELGVRPVFLESYSELNQTLSDLSLAIVEPNRYRDRPQDRSQPLVYERRFWRTLEDCYQNLGCGKSAQVPSDDAAMDLNQQLYSALKTYPLRVIRELRGFKYAAQRNGGEKFALFLWLRTRRLTGESPSYSLNLVGTSAYVHREEWSMRREEDIVDQSLSAPAQSVFTGTLTMTNIDPSPYEPTWRGVVAAPIILAGTSSQSKIGSDFAEILTIGAITLNSTHKVRRDGGFSTAPQDYSVVSGLNSEEFNKLATSLQQAAKLVLKPRSSTA